ncbi:porin [Vibrio parahaemolyticus]|nr:porin [Vibrio parahaemolyticus]
MNKSILSVCVAALFSSYSNAYEIYKSDDSSINLYGQIRAVIKKQENKSTEYSDDWSRAGIKFSKYVNEGLNLFALTEFDIGKDGKGLNGRLHYVGAGTEFGKISFGHQWISGDDVTYMADIAYQFGNVAYRHDKLGRSRHNSLIKYKYDNDNFWINANHGLSEDDENPELSEFYIGTKKLDNFNIFLGGGVIEDSFKVEGNHYSAGYHYNNDSIKHSAIVYSNEYDDSTSKIEETTLIVSLRYLIDEKTSVYSGYEYVEQDITQSSAKSNTDGTAIFAGFDYRIVPEFLTYVELGHKDGEISWYRNGNITNQMNASNDVSFAIGARYFL